MIANISARAGYSPHKVLPSVTAKESWLSHVLKDVSDLGQDSSAAEEECREQLFVHVASGLVDSRDTCLVLREYR